MDGRQGERDECIMDGAWMLADGESGVNGFTKKKQQQRGARQKTKSNEEERGGGGRAEANEEHAKNGQGGAFCA